MSFIAPMKKPKRCGLCPCFHAEHPMHCQAVKAHKDKRIIAPYGAPIPDWCPLVEIPTPHGRLIDADNFKADYSMKNDCAECEKELQGSSKACEYDRIYSKMDFCQWIDNAETVIKAEGSET